MKKKSQIEDINRNMYDFKDDESDFYRLENGLTKEIVETISKEKNDPEWMKEFRLKSLELYNSIPVPDWGPSLDGLNMDSISSYVRANTSMKGDWKEVPEDIKNTFITINDSEIKGKINFCFR